MEQDCGSVGLGCMSSLAVCESRVIGVLTWAMMLTKQEQTVTIHLQLRCKNSIVYHSPGYHDILVVADASFL